MRPLSSLWGKNVFSKREMDIWDLASPVMILSVPPFVDFQNLYFPWVLTKSYHRLGKIYGGKIKHDYGYTKKRKKDKTDCSQLDLIEWNTPLKTMTATLERQNLVD